MVEIPRAPIYRLMKRAGAHRVSDTAVDKVIEYLEEEVKRLTEKAIKVAGRFGRKTVTAEDVVFVLEMVEK